MSKFYHDVSTTSATEAPATGQITIELNGDVLGYGTNEEVLTSLAPSGVVPGVYTQVEVNEKGLVTRGITASTENTVVIRTYSFWEPSLRWEVIHGLNTTDFVANIRNEEGDTVFANIKVVDGVEFWVEFTEATSGKITVTFDLAQPIGDSTSYQL